MRGNGRAWGLALAGALAIGVGVGLGWPEFVAVGAGLCAVPIASLVLVRSPRSVSWREVSAPSRVARGEHADLVLEVSVRGSTRWLTAIAAGRRRRVEPTGDGLLTWPLDSRRRGLTMVGPTRMEFADPFGLRRRLLATREPTAVLVVPRVTPVPLSRPDRLPGAARHGERLGPEQVPSIREYVVGDPVKLIHWRSSARIGTTMVRRMVDTTVPSLLVVLDVDPLSFDNPNVISSELDEQAFERAVDAAASWCWSHASDGQRVLVTTTRAHAPVIDVDVRSRSRAIDWLALVELDTPGCAAPSHITSVLGRRGAGRLVLCTGPSAPSGRWLRTWSRSADAWAVTS